MISGNKDTDREILKRVGLGNVLRLSSVSRKMRHDVCNDDFILSLLRRYPNIEKFKKEESMKKFFAKVSYYVSRLKHLYDFEYEQGEFEKQYNLLEEFCYDKDKLLIKSAEQGEFSLVKYARKYVLEIDSVEEALSYAVEINNMEIVMYLVEKSPFSIHSYEDYALRAACERGYFEMVEYLVENGANIHALEDNPLRKACEKGHLEIVKYLIENGAHIHSRHDVALREAARNNHLEVVKFLIDKGADFHAKNNVIFSYTKSQDVLYYLKQSFL